MIQKSKRLILLVSRIGLAVSPLVVLWWIWFLSVRFGTTLDKVILAIPVGLLTMGISVAIRFLIFRSTVYTLACMFLAWITVFAFIMLMEVNWYLRLSHEKVFEEIQKVILFLLSNSWNLAIGFIIGTFLAGFLTKKYQRKSESDNNEL